MAKSAGSVALSRLGKTQSEIGTALGVSRSIVGKWLDGTRTPNDESRGAIERRYRVASRLWDEPVQDRAPEAQTPTDEPAVEAGDIVAGAKAQLTRLALMRSKTDDSKLIVRIEEIERATRHSLSLYLGEGRVISEAVLVRSPAFVRVMSKLLDALSKHPDALLDVTEVLESIGD